MPTLLLMTDTSGAYPLEGAIQHYDWGGYHFLPDLLGLDHAEHRPYAEYWMGTHPRGAARLRIDSTDRPLRSLIDQHPAAWLGEATAEAYGGQLPFLFKVLDVRKMLSIQAHPTKAQAEAGFAREQEAGIPIDAPHRVFRDANHKPELMVALSDFYLLHGFMPAEEMARSLRKYPTLQVLLEAWDGSSIQALYRRVMTMPQEAVNGLLNPLREQLEREQAERAFAPNTPEHWALEAFEDYTAPDGAIDRGIFSIFLLNLVSLKPGQAIFQAAGIPHAYLSGINVEIMANSDNVFRGGLTAKHVDLPALMDHLDFSPVKPVVLEGEELDAFQRLYPAPVRDFELVRWRVPAGRSLELGPMDSLQILLPLEGAGQIAPMQYKISRGQAIFLRPHTPLTITAEKDLMGFRAGVAG